MLRLPVQYAGTAARNLLAKSDAVVFLKQRTCCACEQQAASSCVCACIANEWMLHGKFVQQQALAQESKLLL